MQSDINFYTPMSNDNGGMRTPVQVYYYSEDDRYVVTVGDAKWKHFTCKTVPQEVKALIAMVNAFPEEVRVNSGSGMQVYVPPDPGLKEIGWELGSRGSGWRCYILVLSGEVFEGIRW